MDDAAVSSFVRLFNFILILFTPILHGKLVQLEQNGILPARVPLGNVQPQDNKMDSGQLSNGKCEVYISKEALLHHKIEDQAIAFDELVKQGEADDGKCFPDLKFYKVRISAMLSDHKPLRNRMK